MWPPQLKLRHAPRVLLSTLLETCGFVSGQPLRLQSTRGDDEPLRLQITRGDDDKCRYEAPAMLTKGYRATSEAKTVLTPHWLRLHFPLTCLRQQPEEQSGLSQLMCGALRSRTVQ